MSEFKSVLSNLTQIENQTPEKAALCKAKRLSKIEDAELKEFLKTLYAKKDFKQKMLATLLNAMFTEYKATFLFSQSILLKLITSDANTKRSSLSGKEYGSFLAFLTVNGLFKRLRDNRSTKQHVASVLELTDNALLISFSKRVGAEFLALQKSNCVNVFDAYVAALPSKLLDQTTSEGEVGGVDGNEVEKNINSKAKEHSPTLFPTAPVKPTKEADVSKEEIGMQSMEIVGTLKRALNHHHLGHIQLDSFQIAFISGVVPGLEKYSNGFKSPKQVQQFGGIVKKLNAFENLPSPTGDFLPPGFKPTNHNMHLNEQGTPITQLIRGDQPKAIPSKQAATLALLNKNRQKSA